MTNIIYCCKKKKKPPIDTSSIDICYKNEPYLNFDVGYINKPIIYEYEPQVKSENTKIKIILETTSLMKVQILIDPYKTVSELIKFYFEIIKRPELFGDLDIRFLLNAKLLNHNSKDLIKNYINIRKDVNTIIIDDINDKIKSIKSETTFETNSNEIKIQNKNHLPFFLNNSNDLSPNNINKINDSNFNSTNDKPDNKPIIVNESINIDIFEYEPKLENKNAKIKIILETTGQKKLQILIDPNKTMTELIKFYFEIIKRPDLFGDPSIRFLFNSNFTPHNSKDLIKKYISKLVDVNTIVIDDLEDKIQPSIKCEITSEEILYKSQFKTQYKNSSILNDPKDLNKIDMDKIFDCNKIYMGKDEDKIEIKN